MEKLFSTHADIHLPSNTQNAGGDRNFPFEQYIVALHVMVK